MPLYHPLCVSLRKLRTFSGAQSGSILILIFPSVVFNVTVRRISSTLAEYDPDPARPSIFVRRLAPETYARLREDADALRQYVARTTPLDDKSLVEQVRFAIAGSRATDRWSPADFVYEPGFVYRLVPAIAWRVLVRDHDHQRQR